MRQGDVLKFWRSRIGFIIGLGDWLGKALLDAWVQVVVTVVVAVVAVVAVVVVCLILQGSLSKCIISGWLLYV